MTVIVPRTCTEIRDDGADAAASLTAEVSDNRPRGPDQAEGGPAKSQHSQPLAVFEESTAYVLLGAPGAGKTTIFENEAKGARRHYVTARNFLTEPVEPEWHEFTLFIDGLDERRAGAADGRTPLDAIRKRLIELGRPRFRLSCREADWFGANDRVHLARAAKDGEIKVLRLDSLSNDSICEILTRNLDIGDADAFVEEARERGIDTLLENPQNLETLAKAVRGGAWPETRKETFELACEGLVGEQNYDHQNANQDAPPLPELLSAAEWLCAVQLLTGRAGYVLPGGVSHGDFLKLNEVSVDQSQQKTLRHALGTRLFKSTVERRQLPAHLQIAEFLAARHLATAIDEGLSVKRVLALMTGGDGGVVSELRGLSAWLAVHSEKSRAEIIERDPIGTILYGDVRGFSPDEKNRMLICLERERQRNRRFWEVLRLDARTGSLATVDMEKTFRSHLLDPQRDDASQRFTAFLLQLLIHGEPIPMFAGLLMKIAREDHRWPGVRRLALDAFIRHRGQDASPDELKALLADVRAGSVSDPDDDLLGVLLTELYPASLSASEILWYLKAPQAPSHYSGFGKYSQFWRLHVPENSTQFQLGELLDGLVQRFEEFLPVLAGTLPATISERSGLGHLPLSLLTRFLEMSKEDDVSPQRLFDWLGVVSERRLQGVSGSKQPVRDWLIAYPNVQKAIVATGAARCAGSPDFQQCMGAVMRRLFDAGRPADDADWCLEQAVAATDSEVAAYFMREVALSVHRRPHDKERVEERIGGNAALRQVFAERLAVLEGHDIQDALSRQEHEAWTRKRQRERQKWREAVISQQAALREGRASPAFLEPLARASLGWYDDLEGDTPEARLRCLLGHDDRSGGDDPVEIVLDALRGTVGRPDVPDASEIARLYSEQRCHRLASPFLAGMELLAPTVRAERVERDETRIRQAFAIHYTTSLAGQSPDWYQPLLDSHPGIAADVLIKLTRAEMRNGKRRPSGIDKLGDSKTLARLASLPLLDAFPVRCAAEWLNDLSRLLRTALLHCDAAEVLKSIDGKLARRSMGPAQRVHWLVAGLLASAKSASACSAASYREKLEEFVGDDQRRARHLASFVSRAGDALFFPLSEHLDVSALKVLVRSLGSVHRPAQDPLDFISDPLRGFIHRIASVPTPEATDALAELRDDDALRPWRPELVDAVDRQSAVRRDAEFRHPDAALVLETLAGRGPSNAADLAALTVDLLEERARSIRDGNTNDWRQYWNRGDGDRPWQPKSEDDCRDALLSDLKLVLKSRVPERGIEAAPEGRYAEETRADIRVSCDGFNVPVEIKKSTSRDLWSAVKRQLIPKYTRDPDAGGYGIYLVFWFGVEPEPCQPPESGPRPNSAEKLRKRLRDTLSSEEARLISICVIDVSLPERIVKAGRASHARAACVDGRG